MSLWTIFLNACGLVGNICFGFGCVPTAYKVLRAGKNELLPVNFAWILWTACATFYTYLLGTYGWNWMTVPIGVIETGAYSAVLWYTYLPRDGAWGCTKDCPACEIEKATAHIDGFVMPDEVQLAKDWYPYEPICPHGYRDWDDCAACRH